MGDIKVDFFNINTGETIWLTRPAQLRAAIESSDLGINRRSDRGWRIGKEWKQRLRMARQDRELMNSLAIKYNGEVTESQLLVAVYAREVRAARQRGVYQEEGKYESRYLESIRDTKGDIDEVSKMDVLEDEPGTADIEELDEPTVTITTTMPEHNHTIVSNDSGSMSFTSGGLTTTLEPGRNTTTTSLGESAPEAPVEQPKKPLSALNSTELKQLADEIGLTFSADANTNAKMREEIRQAIKSKK